jgi:hypothetical protein
MNCRHLAALLALALAAALPALAQPAPEPTPDYDPTMVEVRSLPLTMDKVEKLAAAIDALSRLEAADPGLKAKMDAEPSDDQTVDEKVQSLDIRFPEAANVVHRYGLTSREYILVSLAFLNDIAFVAMKRQGAIQSYPPGSITPANAAFVETNYDMLQQLSQKMSGSPD